MSTCEALQTLQEFNIEPEQLIIQLLSYPNITKEFHNQENITWSFILRKRNRLFLMAKNPFMKSYKEIYSIPLK